MPTRILVIDDSRMMRRHLQRMLLASGICDEVLCATNGADGLETLSRNECDLVMCDVDMPEVGGFEFLRRKGELTELDTVPVIMLTAHDEMAVKIECLERGASDYLTKPCHRKELELRVQIHLRLKHLACVDPLTEIANHRDFMNRLDREFSRSIRYDEPLSLAMVDVDRFKQVNDRYGHPAGDRVLVEISKRLTSTLRTHDTAARYGGEEFALLLARADTLGALVACERCRGSIENEPIDTGNEKIRVTVSIGLACYPHKLIERMEDLVKRADQALYAAKEAGRNQVELFSG